MGGREGSCVSRVFILPEAEIKKKLLQCNRFLKCI